MQMTPTNFLKRLCEGYVRSYRTLKIRGPRDPRKFNPLTDSRAADATHREINFFAQLGEMLGFVARREVARKDRTRWDLSWVDLESEKSFLCMESETFEDRADNTIDKLLRTGPSKAPCYLVGVLGWLKESHFAKVKRTILRRLKGRSLLLLAWVGPDMYHATTLEVIVACDGNICTRRATAEPDNDKYWYAYFDSGWENATPHLRDRPPSPQTNGAK
jgi:hypothetical protein